MCLTTNRQALVKLVVRSCQANGYQDCVSSTPKVQLQTTGKLCGVVRLFKTGKIDDQTLSGTW